MTPEFLIDLFLTAVILLGLGAALGSCLIHIDRKRRRK